MNTPPPLPEQSDTPMVKAIQRAVFKEVMKSRLGNIEFDYGLIERSHAQAEAWINHNPHIEIVQIQTFHSSIHGITVVWYR
ncbi:hypothetical protein [Sulfuriroseicoccus oceanibius]|uniref:Uncharacterized protein n=1 Tax=Sulfuriroseicoccus oceanibius TaxID=2707525 RepID=A0A6B3L932_9BACT|nr:hypothetical protein [Sulfuriroseicoccus oceanibius]QQL45529.1 hypothetical protein G3M56_002760 [Sulfuriroseicoccus oceanibius]